MLLASPIFFFIFRRNCQIRDARLSLVSSWNWSILDSSEQFWTALNSSGQLWPSLDSLFGLEVTRGKLRSLQSEFNLFLLLLLLLLLMFLFYKRYILLYINVISMKIVNAAKKNLVHNWLTTAHGVPASSLVKRSPCAIPRKVEKTERQIGIFAQVSNFWSEKASIWFSIFQQNWWTQSILCFTLHWDLKLFKLKQIDNTQENNTAKIHSFMTKHYIIVNCVGVYSIICQLMIEIVLLVLFVTSRMIKCKKIVVYKRQRHIFSALRVILTKEFFSAKIEGKILTKWLS